MIFIEYAEDGDNDENDVDGNGEWWWLHLGELNDCGIAASTEILHWSHEWNLSTAFRKCQSKGEIEFKALKKISNVEETNPEQIQID